MHALDRLLRRRERAVVDEVRARANVAIGVLLAATERHSSRQTNRIGRARVDERAGGARRGAGDRGQAAAGVAAADEDEDENAAGEKTTHVGATRSRRRAFPIREVTVR